MAILGAATFAGTAWSCVPQPRLVVLPAASATAGSEIIVQGIGFDGSPSTAEIRWNTADGPLLATADQSDFETSVTIPPEARPGLYAILVLSRASDGVLGNTSRAAFEVVDGSSPSTQVTSDVSNAGAGDGSTLAPVALVAGGAVLLALGVVVGSRRERRPASS